MAGEPRCAPGWIVSGGLAAGVAAWVIGWGPLSAQWVRMDDVWLGVLAGKDYLFATEWPADMWALAALYAAAPAAAYALRRRLGVTQPREGPMLLGLAALAAIFAATLPASPPESPRRPVRCRASSRCSTSRVRCTSWGLAAPRVGCPSRSPSPRAPPWCSSSSAGTGAGRLGDAVEHPERPVWQPDLPQTRGRTR